MRTFVTGGSGFVGGHLIRRLVADGHQVSALARSAESAEQIEAVGAKPVPGELAAVGAMATGMSDAEWVFHTAAIVGSWGDPEAMRRVNVDGTANVLKAAREAGVKRVVHVSTESVLLDGRALDGVDEDTPLPESGHLSSYAATKAEAERIVIDGSDEALETVVVRPRLVWGPGDTTWLPGLVEKVDRGVFRWVDGGSHPGSTCHVFNLVQALILAAEKGSPGEVYFVTDGDARSFREFASAYLGTAGIQPDFGTVPGWLMRWAASVVEALWRALPGNSAPPINRVEAAMVGHPMVVDDSKARRDLGYVPVIGFEEGMARLASDLGDPEARLGDHEVP